MKRTKGKLLAILKGKITESYEFQKDNKEAKG